MAQMVHVARELRQVHGFRGYIHLKTIPNASSEQLAEAGLYADRLSINVEMPTEQGLAAYAPEKKPGSSDTPWEKCAHGLTRERSEASQAVGRRASPPVARARK